MLRVLARGPWEPGAIQVTWRADSFQPGVDATLAADRVLEQLQERGSPSHDGFAARMVAFEQTTAGLGLELQPIRWALRLLADDAGASISALCVVRDADGNWLAGRRAAWVASWAGRWAFGAGGSVEVDENPAADAAARTRRGVERHARAPSDRVAVRLASGMVMLVGQAWLPRGAQVTPDHEHDDFAWWPSQLERWPREADAPLRSLGALLETT